MNTKHKYIIFDNYGQGGKKSRYENQTMECTNKSIWMQAYGARTRDLGWEAKQHIAGMRRKLRA